MTNQTSESLLVRMRWSPNGLEDDSYNILPESYAINEEDFQYLMDTPEGKSIRHNLEQQAGLRGHYDWFAQPNNVNAPELKLAFARREWSRHIFSCAPLVGLRDKWGLDAPEHSKTAVQMQLRYLPKNATGKDAKWGNSTVLLTILVDDMDTAEYVANDRRVFDEAYATESEEAYLKWVFHEVRINADTVPLNVNTWDRHITPPFG